MFHVDAIGAGARVVPTRGIKIRVGSMADGLFHPLIVFPEGAYSIVEVILHFAMRGDTVHGVLSMIRIGSGDRPCSPGRSPSLAFRHLG